MNGLRDPRCATFIPAKLPPMRHTFLCLLIASAALAQTPAPRATPTPAPTNSARPIWRCNMPGGTCQILVSAMLSVTSHEYIVDGAARVTEVNVDTSGHLALRFYYIEPAVTSGPGGLGAATLGKVQSLLTEAAERSGTDAWKKVVKSYPATTHARTVEYRVAKRESLDAIFASASRCLTTGRPEEVKIAD
jgi:hypothetical protein